MDTTDQKEYELSFIIPSEDDVKTVAETVLRHNGVIVRRQPPRKISLAFPIHKHREAYFGFFIISLNPANVFSLNHDLNMTGSVIRFLIVSPVAVSAPASTDVSPDAVKPVHSPSRHREPAALPIPPASSGTLTNEALEKKLEEILQ